MDDRSKVIFIIETSDGGEFVKRINMEFLRNRYCKINVLKS